jgi:hypothetical protein
MRVVGWFGFFLGVCVVIVAIAMGLASKDPWFSVGYGIGLTSIISVPLMYFGWRASHPKKKRLVCPNGCNMVQEGTNYCGQCGAKLIWR